MLGQHLVPVKQGGGFPVKNPDPHFQLHKLLTSYSITKMGNEAVLCRGFVLSLTSKKKLSFNAVDCNHDFFFFRIIIAFLKQNKTTTTNTTKAQNKPPNQLSQNTKPEAVSPRPGWAPFVRFPRSPAQTALILPGLCLQLPLLSPAKQSSIWTKWPGSIYSFCQ